MSTADDLRARVDRALAPCLWHGTEGGPHGPQPKGGVRSCSQCERRHDGLVVAPAKLSDALDELDALRAELAALEARHARACELLADDRGGGCYINHNGDCLAHDSTNGCVVADVRAFLGGEV